MTRHVLSSHMLMDNSPKSPHRRIDRYMLVLKIFVVLAVISAALIANEHYKTVSWPQTREYRFLLLALLSQFSYWLIASIAWRHLLRISTAKTISLTDSFLHVSMLLVGKYVPGKIWGMFARGLHLAQYEIAAPQSIRATYLEQLISTHAGIAMGGILWMAALDAPYQWAAWIAGVASVPVVPLIHDRALYLVLPWLKSRWHLVRESLAFGQLPAQSYAEMFTFYIFDWASVGGILVFLFLTFVDAPLTLETTCLLLGANALGMIAGFFAFFAPGGLGVREGVIVAILTLAMPLSDAALLAVLLRLWLTTSDILCGGITMLLRSDRGGLSSSS